MPVLALFLLSGYCGSRVRKGLPALLVLHGILAYCGPLVEKRTALLAGSAKEGSVCSRNRYGRLEEARRHGGGFAFFLNDADAGDTLCATHCHLRS